MRLFNQKGFTLVEILIVLSVISTLFFVLVPQINGFFLKSNESGLRTDFKTFQVASEGFFRETLGNHMDTEGLNKFLDSAHHVTDNGTLLQTKSVDPWHHPYEVEFGVRKISFSSFGEKEDTSMKKYSTVTYLYNGVIDSCTYGFATGNISLSKIKGVPTEFVCGNELSTTPPAESGASVSAPSNFKTLYVEETMASLVWDKVPGATSYVLKRNGVTIYTGSGNTYSDITLARGVTYTYTLAAKNASSTSVYVDLSVTTTLAPPAMTGKGTVADPYIIFSATQLQNIEKKKSAHYALGTDIDASSTKTWNSGKGFIPIGTFYGSLNGREHSIVDLRVHNTTDYTGLFSSLTSSSIVKNLYVIDAEVTGTNHVGIVAGSASSDAIVNNVHSSGTVSASGNYVGGIVGYGNAWFDQVSFEGTISGKSNIGGISAYNGKEIKNARSIATINGISSIGGIAGTNGGKLTDVFADVIITATGDYIGGVIGFEVTDVGNTIKNATVLGSIKGHNMVGGISGINSSFIEHSRSNATITGNNYVGGLVGNNQSPKPIINSHSSGDVTGVDLVGGLIGQEVNTDNLYEHIDVYSTGNITGVENVGGLIGSVMNVNIKNAFASGKVQGSENVGGLIGSSSNVIVNRSYAIGSVNGTDSIGGLVGSASRTQSNNSYATGNILGNSYVGGLFGWATSSNLINTFAIGKVTTTGTSVGGLIGYASRNSYVSSYYDKSTTGKSDTGKGLGKTTAELQTQATYTGWDFTSIWEMNPSKNNGYPTLRTSP